MKLYHGSNVFINNPDFLFFKPYKDFGLGFYLSDTYEQAYSLAVQKARQTNGEPIVTEFEFNESVLSSKLLNVKIFNDYSEEWAQFILDNRDTEKLQPVHDYDFVYGPIADDGVVFQLRRYKRGVIKSLAELIDETRYEKGITFQYYFGTEKALKTLTRI